MSSTEKEKKNLEEPNLSTDFSTRTTSTLNMRAPSLLPLSLSELKTPVSYVRTLSKWIKGMAKTKKLTLFALTRNLFPNSIPTAKTPNNKEVQQKLNMKGT